MLAGRRLRDQTRDRAPTSALFGAAFAAYLVALWRRAGLSRRGLVLALALALVWRVALVAAPPLLCNDVNRYVWEGRVQVHGGNPYALGRPARGAEVGCRCATTCGDGLNHPDYTAIYPPLWQLVDAAPWSRSTTRSPPMKAFVVACELATLVALLALVLRRRGLPRSALLVLAWSPLALVEIAGSGHNEAFGMLLLVLGAPGARRRPAAALGPGRGAGFHVEVPPRPRRRGVGATLPSVARARRRCAPAVALVSPYLEAGSETLLLSLTKYSQFWRFNETLFAPLVAAPRLARGGGARGRASSLALALALAWRRTEPVAAALAVVAATLLLSPNVLPWYALWLVPLLVAARRAGRAALHRHREPRLPRLSRPGSRASRGRSAGACAPSSTGRARSSPFAAGSTRAPWAERLWARARREG